MLLPILSSYILFYKFFFSFLVVEIVIQSAFTFTFAFALDCCFCFDTTVSVSINELHTSLNWKPFINSLVHACVTMISFIICNYNT